METNTPLLILIASVLIALPIALMYVRRWHLAFYALLCYLPIGGVVAMRFGRHPLAIQAADFLFIIPMYLGFMPILHRKMKFTGVPKMYAIVAALFVALVFLQLANPNPRNAGILVGLIGIKVWLFYMPLLLVTYVMMSDPVRYLRMVRIISVTAWIPCTVGILQWFFRPGIRSGSSSGGNVWSR